jgi:hypothetical protein
LRRACTAPLVRFSAAAIERAERPASCRSRSLRSSSSVQALLLFDVIHCQSRNVSAKTQSRRDRSSDYLVCGEQFVALFARCFRARWAPLIATLGTGTVAARASASVRLKLPTSARSASQCGHETGGVSVAGFVTRSHGGRYRAEATPVLFTAAAAAGGFDGVSARLGPSHMRRLGGRVSFVPACYRGAKRQFSGRE